MSNEILLYKSNELAERIEVRLENETVWLNRQQLAMLFGRDVKTIGKHINNVFNEGELQKTSTVANFATVQFEGILNAIANFPKSKIRNPKSEITNPKSKILNLKSCY